MSIKLSLGTKRSLIVLHAPPLRLLGAEGWRCGENTRLPPMWPGFDSRTRRHMWVKFVVGSRPCSERCFSGYSCFSLSSKNQLTFLTPIRSGKCPHAISTQRSYCSERSPVKSRNLEKLQSFRAAFKQNKTRLNNSMFLSIRNLNK